MFELEQNYFVKMLKKWHEKVLEELKTKSQVKRFENFLENFVIVQQTKPEGLLEQFLRVIVMKVMNSKNESL